MPSGALTGLSEAWSVSCMQGAERAQSWAIEQMADALQLPAASPEAWQSTLRFLALQAFFVMAPKSSKVRLA